MNSDENTNERTEKSAAVSKPGVGFEFDLDLVAEAIASQKTIIVPNSHLRDAMLRSVLRQSTAVVRRRPAVYAIDIWIKQTWQLFAQSGVQPCADREILSATEELLLWLRIVEAGLQDYPLLNPQQTASALSHAYQLQRQWQLDRPDFSALQRYDGIEDVRVFLDWQRQFVELCEQHQCYPLADAVEQLTAMIPHQQLADAGQGYLLVNFYQPPPLYHSLLAALPAATSVQSADPERLAIDHLQPQRREYSDLQEEIRACAAWAAEHSGQSGDDRIAVVCMEKQKCEPLFARYLRDALKPEAVLNLQSDTSLLKGATSNPLSDSQVVADALLGLQLHRQQYQSEDICRLLRSPFIGSGDDELEARLQMELLMRRRFNSVCSSASLNVFLEQEGKPHHCPQLRRRILQFQTLLRSSPDRATAAIWARLFKALLECLGWPGQTLNQHERHALQFWQRCLNQFARCSALLQPMDMATAVARLRLLTQQTQREPELQVDTGISLLTPTEAAGQRFDHLWLLNFTDQNFPASVSPAAFLPYELQKQNGLPGSHSDLQYQQCRQEFNVLCSSTVQTLIASHALSDGEQEFRASSFTLALPLMAVGSSVPASSLNRYLTQLAPKPALEAFATASIAPLLAGEEIRGGAAVISDQSACPFRAFARHRLQVDPLETFAKGLDQRARGTAVHIALEHLYAHIPDHDSLCAAPPETVSQWIETATNEALGYLYSHNRELLTPRFRQLEQRRLQSLLHNFLQLERERQGFQVVARESAFSWQAERLQLQLQLKVDRIDRLTDQTLAIIDYKTGRQIPGQSTWLQDRPENMQLPLYAIAARTSLQEPVGALCLAQVNAEKYGYSGLVADNNFHPQLKPLADDNGQDWQSLGDRFSAAVGALAAEFEQGVQRVDPVNGSRTCEFCRLQPLCRIFTTDQAADTPASGTEQEDP